MKRALPSICCIMLLIITSGCNQKKSPEDYLKTVLANLESIHSAEYIISLENWNPGDTVPSHIYCRYIKEYDNPKDTTIGASFVDLACDDTTRLENAYDGNVRVIMYHEHNGLKIDDFTTPRPYEFRLVSPPFFNYTKSIINYILTTNDSITIESSDVGDAYYYKFTIYEDNQIEFFGKAYRIADNSMYYGETTSIYELWISKSNDLPYKYRREMSHNISVETCTDLITLNKASIDNFTIYDYFPADYEIRDYAAGRTTTQQVDITGRKAPDWSLDDMNGQTIFFADIKSKAVIVQITGIGCGPCQISIPYLNELKNKYNADDLDIVAIESWSRRPATHQNYVNRHSINYKFLIATDDAVKSYEAGPGVPVFYIIDNQRIVRKVLRGFGESSKIIIEQTLKEIL